MFLPNQLAYDEIVNFKRNKLDKSDNRFHDWYRFVLSFPPHLVRKYISEFALTSNDLILDPFCGTGTTLIESKLQKIPSIGIEANSFAHFASSVKIDWSVSSWDLLEVSQQVRQKTLLQYQKQGIKDFGIFTYPATDVLRRLDPEAEKIVLKDSISPLPLHKVLILLEEIDKFKDTPYHKYLRLALSNTLVYQFSNLRFGPEVGIGKIKADAAVVKPWYEQILKIGSDLSSVNDERMVEAQAILSDARNLKDLIKEKSVSAVITSPPYPNEKDYTRTTRLESVLMGFISNKDELRALKKLLLRSNTRGIYKGDNDDQYINNFPEIQRIANEIESRRIELGKTSGFERLYHRVTKLYFGGMTKHLIELQSVLKPGAQLAYVVGDQASYLRIMIKTGNLISEIAQSLGYELVKIDLFRTRFSTATKSNLNEEVVILRWPG